MITDRGFVVEFAEAFLRFAEGVLGGAADGQIGHEREQTDDLAMGIAVGFDSGVDRHHAAVETENLGLEPQGMARRPHLRQGAGLSFQPPRRRDVGKRSADQIRNGRRDEVGEGVIDAGNPGLKIHPDQRLARGVEQVRR